MVLKDKTDDKGSKEKEKAVYELPTCEVLFIGADVISASDCFPSNDPAEGDY